MIRTGLISLSAAALLGAAPADPLPRAAMFGVSGSPQTAGDARGVRVDRLGPDGTGQRVGLREGDVILAVDGVPVADMAGLAAAAARLRPGSATRLDIWRDGRRQRLGGPAIERPRETFRNGVARYGAVPFRGGLLREILATPPGGAKGPVVFLIQGYTCDAVETSAADAPHRLLIDGLLARGIATYRIEKPQAGDSRGGPACGDIDFDTEMAGFAAAWEALTRTHGVSPDRVFLLGHSMGGIEAPLLAARVVAPPRGVAAYGTVVRNWHDYLFDVYRVQGFLGTGEDPVEGEARGEALRRLLGAIYLERRTPADVAAAATPGQVQLLRDRLGWDGGERLYGRHYRFWQGLAAQRMLAAWRDTRSNVLSVRGESDIAAIDDEDHKLIAEAVNHYRPGTARYVEVPRTGHGMTIDGTVAEVRAAAQAGSGSAPRPRAAFNPALIDIFGDWIEATMREPTVAARFPAGVRAAGR